jgi:hypothetical protein
MILTNKDDNGDYIYDLQKEIEILKFENEWMEDTLIQIASLPTTGGEIARASIEDLQEALEERD